MKTIKLKRGPKNVVQGAVVEPSTPNVVEDTLFESDGEIVGGYFTKLPALVEKYLRLSNDEFMSNRVPKETNNRSDTIESGKVGRAKDGVSQYSTILGHIPAKPLMRRHYATVSRVHAISTADLFVKSMSGLGRGCFGFLKDIAPELWVIHNNAIKDVVPESRRFAKFFTSAISNFNISPNIHRDRNNLKPTLNIIITARKNSRGGHLVLPEFDLVIEQADKSMLVYPAWQNFHGVTPIEITRKNGYRNTFIFYTVKGF